MGYVKLPSDLPRWAWYSDNNTLAVYVRLILGAAWKDCDYQNVRLQRGQIAITLPQIAEQSNLTIRQTRTILDRLKSTGKIAVERTSKFSIITLINYNCAASVDRQNGSQTADERQTSDSQTTDERQTYFIINRNTEDKKVSKSEVTADAASASPTAASPTKETLIELFGKENVDEYEQRYDSWKAKKGGKVRGDRYETILRMMKQDGVQKPESNSSFDMDKVMENILKQYQKKQ